MKNYIMLFLIFAVTAVLSFINQMVYAHYFGATSSFDMLNAVLSLPFAIIGIGTGAVSLIIMPILSEAKEKYHTCSSTLLMLIKSYYKHIAILAIVVVLIQMFMLYDKIRIDEQVQFLKLNLLSILFLFFSFINSFFIAYYNLRQQFILASVNAMIIYISSIILCYVFADTIGVDIVIYSFIVSNLLLFILFTYNFILNYDKNSDNSNIEYKIKVKSMISGIVSIFPFTFPVFIDSYFLLSSEAGSLSYVSYANKIIIMVTTILIQPINLILFPKILSRVSSQDFVYIKKILLYLYIVTLMGVILIFILSKMFFLDFMHICFERGMFTSNDSQKVYQVFLIYLVGAFGMISMNIQNKVLTSLKLFSTQIYASVAFIILYTSVIMFLFDTKGYLSSGFAYAICWNIYSLFIAAILYKNLIYKRF